MILASIVAKLLRIDWHEPPSVQEWQWKDQVEE